MNGSANGTVNNPAEKLLGRLKADLEYTDIEDVIQEGMHEYLDRLQTRLNQIAAAIGVAFFNLKPLEEIAISEQ